MSDQRIRGGLVVDALTVNHDVEISGDVVVTGSLSADGGLDLFSSGPVTFVDDVFIEGDLRAEGPTYFEGSNGTNVGVLTMTELHTLDTAATSDTTIEIPAGALLLFATVRVTTAVVTSGATNTFDVGIAGATTRFGDDIAGAAGTTTTGIDIAGTPRFYAAGTALRFSAPGVETFSSGVVRVSLHYMLATAPTA